MPRSRSSAIATPRRLRLIRQRGSNDCGAAALAMALRYAGISVSIEQVTAAVELGPHGATALNLMKTASHYDVTAIAIRIDPETALKLLSKGAVLHWRRHHYVVFGGIQGSRVVVYDPVAGRLLISRSSFRHTFSTVAVVLNPDEHLRAQLGCRRPYPRPK